jgi:hypothetical protein
MRTCFLSSQTNAIGGLSAWLNGARQCHTAKNELPPKVGDAKPRLEWDPFNDRR